MQHYLYTETWAGLRKTPVEVVRDRGTQLMVRLKKDAPLPNRKRGEAGDLALVPRSSVVLEND
jgi:hypothetical protein